MSAPARQDPVIHCMCAAHLNTPQRLLRLGQMLTSWRQQQQYLPSLSMSLSHNLDPSFHDAIDRLQQHDRDGKLRIHRQPQPTRQGHHYRYLAMDSDKSAWIMFTDDDDIWSPTRTATLAHVLGTCTGDTDAVLIPCHARHGGIPDLDRRVCLHAATALGDQAAALNLSSASDVMSSVADGTLTHSHALALGAGCYWAYAVRHHVLAAFFQEASDALLAHRAWDLALIRYIHTACSLHVAHCPSDWMYYWRVDPTAAHDRPAFDALRRRRLLGLLEAHCALSRGQQLDWVQVEAVGAAWGVHVDEEALAEMQGLWCASRQELEALLQGPRG